MSWNVSHLHFGYFCLKVHRMYFIYNIDLPRKPLPPRRLYVNYLYLNIYSSGFTKCEAVLHLFNSFNDLGRFASDSDTHQIHTWYFITKYWFLFAFFLSVCVKEPCARLFLAPMFLIFQPGADNY